MRITILLLLCWAGTSFAQTNKLHYQFRIDTSATKARLLVDIKFKAADTTATRLQLPDKWASQTELWKAIAGIHVKSDAVGIDSTDNPSIKILRHKPGQTIRIQYALEQDWEGPLNYPQNYRAIINKQFIHFTGYSLLALPLQNDSTLLNITLDWRKMPANWTIANSLHSGTSTYTGSLLQGELINSLFVAGDFRLHKFLVHDQPVFFAIRDNKWKFSDSTMLASIEKVITAERDFWNDHSEPYYLVTMIPFTGQGSFNGSSLHRAFLTGATTEFKPNINLMGLLSHEYFHRWNGILMSMTGNEQENSWFGEGFTEYYTYKLLYKSGLISLAEYVEKTNSTLSEYYLSPVKNADKITIGKNFWGSRDYQLLPYKKGFAYALYLEQLIQSASNGKYNLDNLMFNLLAAVRNNQPLTEEFFLNSIRQLTGNNIADLHQQYISAGKIIPIMSGSLGAAVSDSLTSQAPFELGFDYDATSRTKTISGVAENSNAWKAGLRNGQPWHGGSIYFGNIQKPVLLFVVIDGNEKKIEYSPMSSETVSVRQFYLK